MAESLEPLLVREATDSRLVAAGAIVGHRLCARMRRAWEIRHDFRVKDDHLRESGRRRAKQIRSEAFLFAQMFAPLGKSSAPNRFRVSLPWLRHLERRRARRPIARLPTS